MEQFNYTIITPTHESVIPIFLTLKFKEYSKYTVFICLYLDYKEERNALMIRAYPELKLFCSSRGLDFQVLDLRWGIPDNTITDHRMEKICYKEIENCQRLSRGPNFIVCCSDLVFLTNYSLLRKIISEKNEHH